MEHNWKDPDKVEGIIGRLFSCRALAATPRHEIERVISPMFDVSHSDASPPAVQPCLLMDREEMAGTLPANILVSGGCASILGPNARSNHWAIPRSVRARPCQPLKFQVIACVQGSDGR